jgi:hypothetical protein
MHLVPEGRISVIELCEITMESCSCFEYYILVFPVPQSVEIQPLRTKMTKCLGPTV